MDLTDGSEVVLPPRIGPDVSISADGSRIASAGDTGTGVEGFRFLDVGDPGWTIVSTAPTRSGAFLTRDGRRMIGSQIVGSPLPADSVVEWDLESRSMSVIAPLSTMDAMSPNGDHVLYRASGSSTLLRWSR
jgi:hypothetical protein